MRGNAHAQPPVIPCLVAMMPKAARARLSVRREMRASCACSTIHAAGRGRPSCSIVVSQAVARSCLGAGRLGGVKPEGGGAGKRIGERSGFLEGMGQVAATLFDIEGPAGTFWEMGSSTMRPR